MRDEDNEADLDEREEPDETDLRTDDPTSVDLEPCPYCGKMVHEMADVCPYCRSFISIEEAPSQRPIWLILGVVLCLLVVLMWVLMQNVAGRMPQVGDEVQRSIVE
jgi:predicted nucleic acid-binding Zn ribbon protein